jgi:hypothetical protein
MAALILVEAEIRLEEGAQLHPPAVQAALEGDLADADDRRRLLGRETLDVAQHDGRAPLGRKLRKRPLDDRLELAIERPCLGTEMRRFRDRGDQIFAVRLRLSTRRRTPAQPSLRLVEGDPIKPGRQPRPLMKAGQAPPRAQEHLLGNVLGLAHVEPEAPQRSIHPVGVSRDDLRERVLVAGAGTLDQLVFWYRGAGKQAPNPISGTSGRRVTAPSAASA